MTTSTKIILKKLKALNTIWHPESALVFKSKEDKVIIGRYLNEALVVDDEMFELCTKWNFRIDDSLLEDEEEEEQSETGEEGGEEQSETGEEGGEEEEEPTPEVVETPVELVPEVTVKEEEPTPAVVVTPVVTEIAVKSLTNVMREQLTDLLETVQKAGTELEAKDIEISSLKMLLEKEMVEFKLLNEKFSKLKSILA